MSRQLASVALSNPPPPTSTIDPLASTPSETIASATNAFTTAPIRYQRTVRHLAWIFNYAGTKVMVVD